MSEPRALPVLGATRLRPSIEQPEDVLAWWTEVANALPFYVLLVDADHNIIAHNHALLEHLGPGPAVGEYCPRLVHGLDTAYPGCPLEEAVLSGRAVEKEIYDAQSRAWMLSAVYPTTVKDRRGKPLFLHFARDITAEKTADADLAASLEHHKALGELLRRLQAPGTPERAVIELVELTLGLSWMDVAMGAVGFLSEGDGLRMIVSRYLDEVSEECGHVPLGSCVCGEAAATRQAIFTDWADGCASHVAPGTSTRLPIVPRLPHAAAAPHGHATFPLVNGEECVGVVTFYIHPEARVNEHQRAFLTAACAVTAVAVAQRSARDAAESALARATALERKLFERVIASQEEERRRVARELHDDLGQGLSALLLEVRGAAQADPRVQPLTDRMEGSIRGIIGRLYQLAWDLRPSVLDDYGLDSALSRYIARTAERTRLTIDYELVRDSGVPERLPPNTELAVYRLAQEAVQNIVRHAEASHASVVVFRRRGSITVLIEDDGKGFDPDAMPRSFGDHGLGLTGMRERACLLQGELVIESAPGQGTSVRVTIPVDE